MPPSTTMRRWSMASRPFDGLGIVTISYVTVDYIHHLSATWHERLQPIVWSLLAVIAISRVPFYKHWSAEFRAVIPFLASLLFLLACLLLEAISVRSVTTVLSLNWHWFCCLKFDLLPDLVRHHQAAHMGPKMLNSPPQRKTIGYYAYRSKSGKLTCPRFKKGMATAAYRIRCRANATLKERIQATKLLSSMDLNVQPHISDPTALGRLAESQCSAVAKILFSEIQTTKPRPNNPEILATARSVCCRVSLKASLEGKYGLLPERFYLKAAKLCSELNIQVEWHHEGDMHTFPDTARPWCAAGRFQLLTYPHPWAQKYYVPYASDSNAVRQILQSDWAYDFLHDLALPVLFNLTCISAAEIEEYPSDYRPDWGVMSFLVEFLHPIHGERLAWYNLLTKAGGGCNDLIYSGHIFVVVLTAMAWTNAKGYDVSKVLLIINVASKCGMTNSN
ncbi:Histone-lysine N-methyltransferase SUVR5 [Linum perenne]